MGSALAAPLALAACDIDPPAGDADDGPATPPPPEDSELVAAVLAELVRAGGVLEAAASAVPALAAQLSPVTEAHAEHRDLLVGAVPDADLPTSPPASVPDAVPAALRAVRRSERRLLRVLRDGCLAAASGDLARVLASMAASTSQHAAALSMETPR
jgi:hypothetical protein